MPLQFQLMQSILRHSLQWRSTAKTLASSVLLTSVVVTGAITLVRNLGGLQGFELSAYDRLIRLRPPGPMDDRLLVVGINEDDIQTRREYPIADGTLADLLQRLQRSNPRVIAIDIARDVPQGDGRTALLNELTASDRILSACVLSSADDPGLPAPEGVSSDRVAFADLPQDANGIIRRSILVSTPAPSTVPVAVSHLCNDSDSSHQHISLSFATALLYLATDGIAAEETAMGEIQLGQTVLTRLGDRAVGYHRTDAVDYQILLNYRAATDAVRVVSLTDVLTNQVDPEWITDRAVLIGYTSETTKDFFYTPYSGNTQSLTMPGVMIHAQAVSQLLSAAVGERALIWYWSEMSEILWILGWSLVGGAIAWATRRVWVFVVLEGMAIGLLGGTCYILLIHHGWVPLVPPGIALATTAIGVILLERAHREGYTQAIYEQVKQQVTGGLSLTIEINQEKRAKQVAEITEAGYFQDLMARAKAIREQRAQEAEEKTVSDPKSP